jgi:hypothetical protein
MCLFNHAIDNRTVPCHTQSRLINNRVKAKAKAKARVNIYNKVIKVLGQVYARQREESSNQKALDLYQCGNKYC